MGEIGIDENLHLQKSGISKYRIGTKWRRYTRLILDVVLLATQESPLAERRGSSPAALHRRLARATPLARRYRSA
ncbi:hypothetical protein [Bradyrhizobium sp. CCBAU 53421]|uniref:hypothetical protein n=1 Tax=Bradyrhizobium sp. CCBAU 53421 TaxID=1325120 RepID=UPI00188C0723|nr:hypothetical protein [Bradyrhizobium sp. CCBAU 53421]